MSAPAIRRAARELSLACAAALACALQAHAQVMAVPTAASGAVMFATDASRDATSGAWVPQFSAAGRLSLLRWRGFGLDGASEGMALLPAEGSASGRALGAVRLTFTAGGGGLWAGGGAGGSSHDGRSRALFVADAGGRWRWKRAGVSLNLRQTRVSAIPATYSDSLVPATDTSISYHVVTQLSSAVRERRYTEAELLMELARGPVRLEARTGGRLERATRRPIGWAQAAADLQLSRRAALTLAAGRLRGTPELESRPSPFLSLMLRLAPGRSARAAALPALAVAPAVAGDAAAFEVHSAGTLRTLTVRVPGAARMEMKADFTDWQPRALSPGSEPGTWELAVPLAPGTYRVNLRVDGGEWNAPPGLPDLDDEFGGRVGVLVIG